MPEGTNHAPAQNRASDAKARALIPARRANFSPISPVLLAFPDVGPTAKLSGGTNLLGCEADDVGEVTTASADCWRRANQRARPIFISHSLLIGTCATYWSANKELKSGSLASPLPTRAARRQRPNCAARLFCVRTSERL